MTVGRSRCAVLNGPDDRRWSSGTDDRDVDGPHSPGPRSTIGVLYPAAGQAMGCSYPADQLLCTKVNSLWTFLTA